MRSLIAAALAAAAAGSGLVDNPIVGDGLQYLDGDAWCVPRARATTLSRAAVIVSSGRRRATAAADAAAGPSPTAAPSRCRRQSPAIC